MLLTGILKVTDKKHSDYKMISQAISKITRILDYANRKAKEVQGNPSVIKKMPPSGLRSKAKAKFVGKVKTFMLNLSHKHSGKEKNETTQDEEHTVAEMGYAKNGHIL
eukprot:TRINITY_DN5722_c0_g1_i2.p1 TRINITY_DN5722_c0_g1~~TRINITY_DN5722_c0_g1_i2.p1  ORF type:complete len:108 (+),score=18.51 TRINITY_DN5722_c0_g1_i2:254-577(+)